MCSLTMRPLKPRRKRMRIFIRIIIKPIRLPPSTTMPAQKRYFLLLLPLLFSSLVFGQNNGLQQVKQYHTSHEQEIVNDFISFLSIPNVATDTQHIRGNADFLFSYMQSKGIEKVQLLEGDEK